VNKLFRNKELSWLSFNERVLQEASNPEVPLIERIRFLGIFSSNLDEFFRIRVATLRRLMHLGRRAENIIGHNPKKILKEIQTQVVAQHQVFDEIFQDLSVELAHENIFIINEKELNPEQGEYVRRYFHKKIRQHLISLMIDQVKTSPGLRDQSTYLAIRLATHRTSRAMKYALIELTSYGGSRFVQLPSPPDKTYIILLDDVIRYCLDDIFAKFGYKFYDAYAIKITQDAELDFDEDINQSFIKKLTKGLQQRKKGPPVRFVYDARLPKPFFNTLVSKLKLTSADTFIPGAIYHNFRDFMNFPDFGRGNLRHPVRPVLSHPAFVPGKRIMDAVEKQDIILHYPYQSFEYVLDFLREAAIDPSVSSIKLTIYRAAKYSRVMNALINASRNGKSVTAVLELQARFDEEANLSWGNILQEEGVRVIYGVPGLKVHAKLCLITRREGRKKTRYAIVGTGNFNEDTARVYSDHSLFTIDKRITGEVSNVFRFYGDNYKTTDYHHLIVSPFNMRKKIKKLIRSEIKNARAGKEAFISLKLNNLVDPEIIRLLYDSDQAGVQVKLIVRSMFSLRTELPGYSDGIEAISIVDKYLEHSRIFVFANGGKPLYYISSADLMQRNLDGRVEVTCPIYDQDIQRQLQAFLDIQWRDNCKARILDKDLKNRIRTTGADTTIRSQEEIYDYLSGLTAADSRKNQAAAKVRNARKEKIA